MCAIFILSTPYVVAWGGEDRFYDRVTKRMQELNCEWTEAAVMINNEDIAGIGRYNAEQKNNGKSHRLQGENKQAHQEINRQVRCENQATEITRGMPKAESSPEAQSLSKIAQAHVASKKVKSGAQKRRDKKKKALKGLVARKQAHIEF